MTNHLYDELLGQRGNDRRTFLDVPGSAERSFSDMHALAGQVATTLVKMGVKPGTGSQRRSKSPRKPSRSISGQSVQALSSCP